MVSRCAARDGVQKRNAVGIRSLQSYDARIAIQTSPPIRRNIPPLFLRSMAECRDASGALHPAPPGEITPCFLSPGATASARPNNGEQYRQERNPPSALPGCPSQMADLYQDATAEVRTNGNLRLFTTFTCNPSWADVQDAQPENHASDMRQDIAARVFRLKLDALLENLTPNSAIGRVFARPYVVEFQKGFLTRAHILCILDNENAPRSTDDYDDIARAVIPDPEKEHAIWRTVTTSTMHGPCGPLKPNAARMDGGSRTKGRPKRFNDSAVKTQLFPEYKRPDDGRAVLKRGGEYGESVGSSL